MRPDLDNLTFEQAPAAHRADLRVLPQLYLIKRLKQLSRASLRLVGRPSAIYTAHR